MKVRREALKEFYDKLTKDFEEILDEVLAENKKEKEKGEKKMSKSIYEEALEDLSILVKQANARKLSNDIVVNRWGLERIEKVINQAQKQEKLLGLYRQLVLDLGLVIEYDTTDDWNGPVDYEYLEINDNGLESLKTYKKIKEIENE